MGLTWNAFDSLLQVFKPHLPDLTRRLRGRPRITFPEDVLGLCLHWLNSTMRQKTLAQIFGIVPSCVSLYLNMGLEAVDRALQSLEFCQVRWPDPTSMAQYAAAIHAREPALSMSIGFVDGLNLRVAEPSEIDKQNAYYNGWLSGCYVSNVFVFTPNGKICFAALNRPGSWHDAQVARELYNLLLFHTPEGYNILADSAFPMTRELAGKIKAVYKQPALDNAETPQELARMLAHNEAVTGQRQSAEWGMRSLQGAFGRLRNPLPDDNTRRAMILRVVTHMHNFRAEKVGLNQIRSVYWTNNRRTEQEYNL